MSASSRSIGLLLATLIATQAPGALAGTESRETREARFALVVGNNAGREPDRTLRYAEQEVARLADLLRRTGDFERVEVQQGQPRVEVEAALQSLKKGIEQARADGRRTLFFFYYSGHADGEALELGPSRLPLRTLSSYLENLSADIRLAFIDACRSGAITGVKGGRRAPTYEIRIADVASVRGLAIVTSSTANEPSQESDDLRSSYFSHNVMAGLQGLADSSGDGQITLSELYDFAFRRTLASTAANATGGQHPTYAYRLSGTGEVVLTRAPAAHARLRFPGDPGATYSVLRDDEILAEVAASPGSDSYLALPAGDYRVLRRSLAHLTETRLRLKPGGSVLIQPARMAQLAGGGSALGRLKGRSRADAAGEATLRSAAPGSSSSLDLQVAWQTPVGPAKGPVPALQAGYTRQISPRLGLRLRLDFSRPDPAPGDPNRLVRLVPGVDLLVTVLGAGPLQLRLGPSAGLALVEQAGVERTSRSFGLQLGGVASLGLDLGAPGGLSLVAAAVAAAELFRLDGERVVAPFAGASLGGAYRF